MRFKTYFCAFFTILVIYIGICEAKKSDHENNRSLLPSERGNSEVQLRNTESNLPSLSSELQILKEFGSNSTDELNPSGKPKRKRKNNKHHNHRGRNGHRRGHLRSGHHHKRQRTRPTDILRAEEDPKAEVGKKSDDKTSKLETSSTELRNGRRNKRLRSRGSRHLGFNTHHHSHHHQRSQHEFNQNDERPQHHHRQHRRLHHRRKHHNSQNPKVDPPAAKLNTLDKIDETSSRRILDR